VNLCSLLVYIEHNGDESPEDMLVCFHSPLFLDYQLKYCRNQIAENMEACRRQEKVHATKTNQIIYSKFNNMPWIRMAVAVY